MFSFSLRGIISVTMVMVCFLIPGSSLAQQWECLGLEHEWIETIVVDPVDDNIIYAGAFNAFMDPDGVGGIFKSTNAGATWDTLLTDGVCPARMVIHPRDSQILYASLGTPNASFPGVMKTTNGGEDWFWAGDGIYVDGETSVIPIAIDPLHPDTLYVGTGGFFGGSLFRTYNGGQSWEDIGNGVNDTNKNSIAIDPNNVQTVYVGCLGEGFLFKTTNGGDDWDQLPIDVAYGFYCLAINPLNTSMIYGSAGYGTLYKSTDSGDTWSDPIFEDDTLGIRYFALKESNPDSIYLATSKGVYYSTDAGLNWETINSGIEDIRMETITFSSSGNYLFCGSDEGGIYRLTLNPDISIELPVIAENSVWLSSNYPNPFSNFTTINYSLASPNKVSLNVYDITGQFITTLVNARQLSGEHRFAWNGKDSMGHRLSPGTYLYQLKIGEYTETKRLTIVR